MNTNGLVKITLAVTLLGFFSSTQAFKICKNQTYALCATARCSVLNGVAYCQCMIKSGDSISLPFQLSKNQDVCSINAAGVGNGYMVSTYSLPDSILIPKGTQAVYTCPGGKEAGAYAQCDGGLCFTSTEGKSFPGFDKPIPKGQIICACPITVGSNNWTQLGHQMIGPYPCQDAFFKYCNKDTANSKDGSVIYVGAPIGIPKILTIKLYGRIPALNQCRQSTEAKPSV